MNAEYHSHERVWDMVKPRMDEALQSCQRRDWSPGPVDGVSRRAAVQRFAIDPIVLAHGHRELRSPLAEW